MQYCTLHKENPSHSTLEFLNLTVAKKWAKEFTPIQSFEKEKQRTILYNDLNVFINTKVEQAFKTKAKAKKEKKERADIAL